MKRTDLVKALVNKMLEKYGVDYNFVFNNPRINGIEWFRLLLHLLLRKMKHLKNGLLSS